MVLVQWTFEITTEVTHPIAANGVGSASAGSALGGLRFVNDSGTDRAWSAVDWPTANQVFPISQAYFEFALSPNQTASDLIFDAQTTSTGPKFLLILASVDGNTFAPIATVNLTTTYQTFTVGLGSPAQAVRLAGFGASASSGRMRVDNVQLRHDIFCAANTATPTPSNTPIPTRTPQPTDTQTPRPTPLSTRQIEPPHLEQLYLPLIQKADLRKADLRPIAISSLPQSPIERDENLSIQIVIRNDGAKAADNFWVDLYIDPTHPPDANHAWQTLCTIPWPTTSCYGTAWHITDTLQPGQSMTLSTQTQLADSAFSHWTGVLPQIGPHAIYVQVDSYTPLGNSNLIAGEIDESDERNNVLGPFTIEVIDNTNLGLPPIAPTPWPITHKS